MRLRIAVLILILWCVPALAQGPNGNIPANTYQTLPSSSPQSHGAGAPTATCSSGNIYTNDSNGVVYSCNAGTNPNIWTQVGGGSAASAGMSIVSVSRNCGAVSNCTTIVGDMNFDVDATFTASSPTVTTSSAAPAFVAASVPTQVGFGTFNCTGVSEAACTNNCPQSTMTYVSAHVVTLSNNCTSNSSAAAHSNIFVWCTDDGTALNTAFQSMFPGASNSAQTQELDLPAGGMCMGDNPFVAPTITPRQNPIILRGHNTEIVPLPNMSCNQASNKGCLIYTGFQNNALGNIGSSDAVYDITFWGGGTSDKGASATFANPAYGIYGGYGANYYNVWVVGWVWDRSCSTPVYGWRLSGSNTWGSGDYAGGAFGVAALGFNGAPTTINGGNWGAGVCSSVLVTGSAGDGGVNTHGIYFDQPFESGPVTCGAPAVSTANCYQLQVTSGTYRDFGSNPAAFINGGDAWFTGSQMNGFGSVDDMRISSGTATLVNDEFRSHIEQTGGTIFFAGGNHTPNSTAPFTNPAFQTMTGGVANAYQAVTGACTGVATSSSTLGLYGTGPNQTTTTCTSTTIGSGIVMQQAGTMGLLQVSASAAGHAAGSGVVTVLKNGAGTTITCTVGTGTSCFDVTHYVSYAVGDLISINFTTQATETLAGVNASVMTAF